LLKTFLFESDPNASESDSSSDSESSSSERVTQTLPGTEKKEKAKNATAKKTVRKTTTARQKATAKKKPKKQEKKNPNNKREKNSHGKASKGARKRTRSEDSDGDNERAAKKRKTATRRGATRKAARLFRHALFAGCYDEARDGVIDEVEVYLGLKSALEGPDAPHWRKALDKETARLEGYKVWGEPLTQGQISDYLAKGVEIVPLAMVLSRKRDGTYKCRGCALGNRLSTDSEFESFAPVVSQPAAKHLVITAASRGDHLSLFDLDSAYLNAILKTEVLIKLPPDIAEKNAGQIRLLKKALYGLRSSGRLWYDLLKKELQGDSRRLRKESRRLR
jgi:hypothetical protein